jgi:hypothetical protein
VMGSHELNALAYHTEDPESPGQYLPCESVLSSMIWVPCARGKKRKNRCLKKTNESQLPN